MAANNKCPVCDSSRFSYIGPVFSKPDLSDEFSFYKERYFVRCLQCTTIMQTALGSSNEGRDESYYNQMTMSNRSADASIRNHISLGQIPAYKGCERFFREHIDGMLYHRWLDVGSAGVPVSFQDYDFTTVEQDSRTVALGREIFKSDKIICATFESFETSNIFDGILFHSSFYCMRDPNLVLQKARRLLRDDGLIVIAICSYFMDTSSTADDLEYRRTEDIVRGDVLWVYYNPFSLKYLCNKHGFELQVEHVIQYQKTDGTPWFSNRYFIFRKCMSSSSIGREEDLDKAKEMNERLLNDMRGAFLQISRNTLEGINTPDHILIGTRDILFDLIRISPLNRAGGFVDLYNMERSGPVIDGLRFLSIGDIPDSPDTNIVIATFRHAQEALSFLRQKFDNAVIQVPTRSSGVERIFSDDFGGICKAFEIRKHERELDK